MAAAQDRSPGLLRLQRILGFFIGIFGAMAILGVFFKILKYPNYELFMVIGFCGEAAAFVVMGLFELIGAFTIRKEKDGPVAEAVAAPGVRHDVEVVASFRKMLEKQVADEVNAMMGALAKEIRHLGEEIHGVGGELERTRLSVQNLREELDKVTTGDLAGDAVVLGHGMQRLGKDVHEMGSQIEQALQAVVGVRQGLGQMASANLGAGAAALGQGVERLGSEVHEVSKELELTRGAVSGMRGELDKVLSGDLAGDAEVLGHGMKRLGSEMAGAGHTVEKIRSDLEQMATRFRLFNEPLPVPHELSNGHTKKVS